MAETFDFNVEAGADGEVNQRTWDNDFGDGYIQSGGTGINTKSQSWSVSHTGQLLPGEEIFLIRDFLDRHEGYRSFFWVPPGGQQGRYKVNGYKLKALGVELHSISFTMKQVFTPY